MSHRIKRFAAFAIFYHFAAVDSILGLGGHHVDTKNHQHNDKIKSTRRDRFGVHVSRSLSKGFVLISFSGKPLRQSCKTASKISCPIARMR
jgi:hypothetical protein